MILEVTLCVIWFCIGSVVTVCCRNFHDMCRKQKAYTLRRQHAMKREQDHDRLIEALDKLNADRKPSQNAMWN